MKQIFYSDPKTGIEAGLNADGELYFGNGTSGGTMRDTPENRERLKRDFERYTGNSSHTNTGEKRLVCD